MRYCLLIALISPLAWAQTVTPAAPTANASSPTSSVSAFAFDASKVPVGRLLRYTKSNRDGSKPIEVLISVTSGTDVEVVKIENAGRYLAHIKGQMDWARFTFAHVKSWNQVESGTPNLQAELTLDAGKHLYTAQFGPTTAPSTIGHYPLVVYNFDFAGANLIWPFLKNPESTVELGVSDPDFDYMATKMKAPGLHPGAFPYRGAATFRYVGDVEHKGIPCRKYVVGGAAFGGKEGLLLVNKAHGYWELFEHPQADNPAWRDFKFELQSVQALVPGEWDTTFKAIVRKAQGPMELDSSPVTGMSPTQMLDDGLAAADGANAQQAIRLLQAFTAQNPHLAQAWSGLADALYEGFHFADAAQAYGKAAELGLNPAQNHYYAAGSLAKAGQRAAALAELRVAMHMGFENPPGALEDKDLRTLQGDARFRALMGAKPNGVFSRTQQWRHDITWLVQELKRKHVHWNAKQEAARLDAEVARLVRDIPTLSDANIVTRMAQVMALVGDGHTALLPPVPGQFPYSMGAPLPALKLAPLPLRFYVFGDGVRVIATGADHHALLGSRVVKVNGVPIADVMKRLTPTVSRENAMWVKEQLPARLQVPAILAAVGVGRSGTQATLTLDVLGRDETHTIATHSADATLVWHEAAAPNLRENRDKPYWDRYLPDSNTMLVRYNLCRKGAEDPAVFWKRVVKEAQDRQVARLVIDLSANSGGSNDLNKPMLAALRSSAWINQRGRLYVVIGRATFSAAMNAAADLERETRAIFVGEPTGSAPSFAGEASPVRLPFSGLSAMVSSRYFQGAAPTDKRTWIAPTLLVEPDLQAWQKGLDQPLLTILAQPTL